MTKRNSWRKRWQWLGIPVAFLALGWTIFLLWDALPTLQENLLQVKIGWLVFVLLGSTLSAYLIFEAFYLLFEQMRTKVYEKSELANLYFMGQRIKHLPGRVWSVAYQVAMGNRVSTAEWIAINAVFAALSIWFALTTSIVVLAFTFGWKWGVLCFVFFGLLYKYFWQNLVIDFLLSILNCFSLSFFRKLSKALKQFSSVQKKQKSQIWILFVSGWLTYLIAWAGYGLAWPNLSLVDGIWLCAFYTIAWFIGYISLVTPSGIGVRELVFFVLAKDFSPDVIAGIAILGRVMLLLVDVVLSAIFIKHFHK